ncbi:DinB family protein [Flindersiella endophytica]
MNEFSNQDLSGSTFRKVRLRDAHFHAVDLTGTVFRDVELVDVEISGELRNLRINDVDVVPLIDAELNRRYPGREKMRPSTAAGFGEAWEIVDGLWAQTVTRARGLAPELLHERVNDEWSFIETLRHLVFATDAWINRVILGNPSPWHPLDLPFDEMDEHPSIPWDRTARPALDEVLALRADRIATMRRVLADLTDEQLDQQTKPVDAPGWPPPEAFLVRDCLECVLNEEWQHRLYAERDLDVLEARGS